MDREFHRLDLNQQQSSDRLDNSFIEIAIFALFKINIVEHIKLKASMTKQFNIPPQSFDEMPYWEFEIYLKLLNNAVKEENESQKAEMDKYHISDYSKMASPSNMKSMMNPKMPTDFKIPKF